MKNILDTDNIEIISKRLEGHPQMIPLIKYLIEATHTRGLATHPLELTSWFMEDLDFIMKATEEALAQKEVKNAN